MTGIPLMKKMMSVRMSGVVPRENMNSSVTWNALASSLDASRSWMFSFSLLRFDKDSLQPPEISPSFRFPSFGSDTDKPVAYLFRFGVVDKTGVKALQLIE